MHAYDIVSLEGSMKKYMHHEWKNFASLQTILTEKKRYVLGHFMCLSNYGRHHFW